MPELPSAGASAPPRQSPRWRAGQIAAAAILAALVVASVLAYRAHQRRRIVAESLARAEKLLRSDTWLGYHEAAAVLGVRAAALDPVQAGSVRALALAMLAADYRDAGAAAEASALLVGPGRAAEVPAEAQLAYAALAIAAGEAGTATTYASRAGDRAFADVLGARIALLAGNAPLAADAVARALSRDPELPAALALRGDLLRRAGKGSDARDAYDRALAGSARALEEGLAGSSMRPEGASAPHARAALGLGKLALSRAMPAAEAIPVLARLAADRAGTPQVERVRAALHLAALMGRAGDRLGAVAVIDGAGLDGSLRGWLEKAAGESELERGPYRGVAHTPPSLVSASDDDLYVPPPPPPPPKAAPAPPARPYGFKVHGPARKPKASPAAKNPAARSKRAPRAG